MSDDQDVQKKTTRRMDPVDESSEPKEQVADRWGLDDESSTDSSNPVRVQRDSTELETLREVPVSHSNGGSDDGALGGDDSRPEQTPRNNSELKTTVSRAAVTSPPDTEDDEKTALLDREELLQHAAEDHKRGQNRNSKETVRMETPFPVDRHDSEASSVDSLSSQDSQSLLDKTCEMKVIEQTTRPAIPIEQGEVAIDGTDEFARHGISTVEEDATKVTFPARLDEELRIVLPPEVAREADVEPGDLVVVELRKVE